ncbi:VWA domain-containing protein [Marinomonas sp. IMCC 4694]|uniref:VWA domain-containing protein n=1 Tax=Marinomonas sp. IMCC 4694 TaxID=2605432 RepID=UPI0011E86F5B|nr:VWA domain-containing protein [Marinomonas sp. IMCC 4694]TYL47515.1 VWA domain-containing protein [Marinomonas sp. IMCC 4694]
MLELTWPWFLWLLPVPLLMYFLPESKTNTQAIWWNNTEQLQHYQDHKAAAKRPTLKYMMLLAAWGLLVTAMTQPIWLGEPTKVTPSGRDLLIALDLSGSMQVSDMTLNDEPANRLNAAKSVLADFIEARQGDRIGIIVFGSKAYLQAPLSFDTHTINQLVQEAQIGFAGEQTAIGDAIGLGIKRLEDKPSDKKVLILMTDGANTAGRVQPQQAAAFAQSQNVRIHTIGIGADSMVVQSFFGAKVVNPSSDLDETLLRNIAAQTGGEYFRAKSTQDLQAIYQTLNDLEPTPDEAVWQRPLTSLFHWLSLASMVCLGLSLLVGRQLAWRQRAEQTGDDA